MSVRTEMKAMSPRKLAMRFLSMGPDERRAKIAEFFSGPESGKASVNRVTWQYSGDFSDGLLQVSYSATSDLSTLYVQSGWVALNNGTPEGDSLGCSVTTADGVQTTTTPASLAGLQYLPLTSPPAVVAVTLIAQLSDGETQSQVQFNIPTASKSA